MKAQEQWNGEEIGIEWNRHIDAILFRQLVATISVMFPPNLLANCRFVCSFIRNHSSRLSSTKVTFHTPRNTSQSHLSIWNATLP